jgi:squalene cyclase
MNCSSRRSFLLKSVTSAFCVGGLPRLLPAGQQSANNDDRDLVTPAGQRAIQRGLVYLAAGQHADGSFGSENRYTRNVGITGLCGMALRVSGRFKANVAKGVDFVLSKMQADGLIIAKESRSHGPMYGHAFATQFLAEVARENGREDLLVALKKAVKLIVASQNDEGGWRYLPKSRDADLSVTVCQVLALRAARAAGLDVAKPVLDRATDYVKQCQNDDGGFRYQLSSASKSVFPRSAAAMTALYLAGIDDRPRLERGRDYLNKYLPSGNIPGGQSHYFYGHYFAARAMREIGGEHRRRWYAAIRDELVEHQSEDGSWLDNRTRCSEYATAMACLILQTTQAIPRHPPKR